MRISEEDRLFIMNLEGPSLSGKSIWVRLPHCRRKSTAMLGYMKSDTNNATIGRVLEGTRIGDVLYLCLYICAQGESNKMYVLE